MKATWLSLTLLFFSSTSFAGVGGCWSVEKRNILTSEDHSLQEVYVTQTEFQKILEHAQNRETIIINEHEFIPSSNPVFQNRAKNVLEGTRNGILTKILVTTDAQLSQ